MLKNPFTKFEKQDYAVWFVSVMIVTTSFLFTKKTDMVTMTASLVGVTSLIFLAKGEPIGQILMLVFSVLYSIVSYEQKYYGEMITYLGMTAPMALMSLVTWLKNPYKEGETQVKVEQPTVGMMLCMILSGIIVTTVFYYILKYFGNESLFFSSLSVMTSFIAAFMTFLRYAEYALGYALNDIVLIILWIIASLHDPASISMTVCFCVFLYNDLYGYISWRKMKKKQEELFVGTD